MPFSPSIRKHERMVTGIRVKKEPASANLARKSRRWVESATALTHYSRGKGIRDCSDPIARLKKDWFSALARAHRGSFEKINEPFLFRDGASPAEYGAGLKLAIERGWLT